MLMPGGTSPPGFEFFKKGEIDNEKE